MKNFNLTNDFNKILENNKIVIFQYGSITCAPCHSLKYKLTEWQKENSNIEVYYIPIEDNIELAAQNGILSAPTIEVYIEGKLFVQRSGYFSLDEILNKVEKYKSILY